MAGYVGAEVAAVHPVSAEPRRAGTAPEPRGGAHARNRRVARVPQAVVLPALFHRTLKQGIQCFMNIFFSKFREILSYLGIYFSNIFKIRFYF